MTSPVITLDASVTIAPGQTDVITATANQTVFWDLTVNPYSLFYITSEGLIKTSGVAPNGTYSVTVRATNLSSQASTDTISITVSGAVDTEALNAEAQDAENKLVNVSLTQMPYPYVTGLKLRRDIHLGNLTLNQIDENGVVWVCTDIEGWWNVPDPELPELTRGWGDGSYDARGRYAARVVTLSGSILTQSPDQAPAAREKLFAALNLVYTGGWLVVDESPAKSAYVRLTSRPEVASASARGRIDFSVGLRAADPIKYEWTGGSDYTPTETPYTEVTLTKDTNISITNSGNTRVPVIFEISGTITSGGLIRRTANAVVEEITGITKDYTGTLEIDTYNREILKIENDEVLSGRSYADTVIDWIYLEPGVNTLRFEGTGTSPTCKIYYRSGWIGS
jgi:hypothetical protein